MDSKQDIITTARKRFETVGIKSVSMDDISRELGISKKTLYVYFPQKEDLIRAVLENINGEIESMIQNFLSSTDSVWDLLVHFVENSRKLPDVRRIPPFIYDLNKYYPAIAHEHNEMVEHKNISTISAMINRGIREGIFRHDLDVMLAACMLSKMHSSAIENSVKYDDPNIPRRLAEFAFDVFIRGILTEEGLRKYETLKPMVDETLKP